MRAEAPALVAISQSLHCPSPDEPAAIHLLQKGRPACGDEVSRPISGPHVVGSLMLGCSASQVFAENPMLNVVSPWLSTLWKARAAALAISRAILFRSRKSQNGSRRFPSRSSASRTGNKGSGCVPRPSPAGTPKRRTAIVPSVTWRNSGEQRRENGTYCYTSPHHAYASDTVLRIYRRGLTNRLLLQQNVNIDKKTEAMGRS